MSKRKYPKFTNVESTDGIFTEVNGRFCVKRTLKTPEEVSLLHSRLPDSIAAYQSVIVNINRLLNAMKSRADELTAATLPQSELSCSTTTTPSMPQVSQGSESSNLNNTALSQTVDVESLDSWLRRSEVYEQYAKIVEDTTDFTLPCPATPERVNLKFCADVAKFATQFNTAAEAGEQKLEPRIWRKIETSEDPDLVSVKSPLFPRFLRKSRDRIYGRVSVATEGIITDPKYTESLEKNDIAEGVSLEDPESIVVGKQDRESLKSELMKESLEDINDEECPVGKSWFIPDYEEPFANSDESAEVVGIDQSLLDQRKWCEATQQLLNWAQNIVTHACANA